MLLSAPHPNPLLFQRTKPLRLPRSPSQTPLSALRGLRGRPHSLITSEFGCSPHVLSFRRKHLVPIERRASTGEKAEEAAIEDEAGEELVAKEVEEDGMVIGKQSSGSRSPSLSDWTTSVLLFGFYAAILYYASVLAPNQTPSRDLYFVQKLLNLKGDDGFQMNEVLVALWNVMPLWSLLYSMLLLPTARSSNSKVPVWPFLSLSFFFGAYALIPYFILWSPPPPPVDEEEIGKWPLNFLESKVTAGVLFAAGLGLVTYAGFASGEVWDDFFQYFRESRLVHATSLDFTLLSAFSAFWVYNDMTARRWIDKGSWLLPISLVPVVGPALYVLLRPSLSSLPTASSSRPKTD